MKSLLWKSLQNKLYNKYNLSEKVILDLLGERLKKSEFIKFMRCIPTLNVCSLSALIFSKSSKMAYSVMHPSAINVYVLPE